MRHLHSWNYSYDILIYYLIHLLLNSYHRSVMLGHLVLSVPEHKYQTREEDITAGEKVRVFRTCPVLDSSVSGPDETCLDGDSYYSTD